uniref:Alcohol dehydrogenase-like C-terminal domain-containing protein n=1 Tax=Clastoptera arizonana TaxID=38151 RepID=A0A1B6C199_9HEMI
MKNMSKMIYISELVYIYFSDLVEHRLKVAKQCGADYTLLVKSEQNESEITKAIINLVGEKPNITLDCSGFESTIRLGLEATKNGGVLLIVGMGSPEVKVPLTGAASREIDIRGVFRYCNDYPLALAMVATGQVNVKQLITHHFNIEQTNEAFELAKSGKGNPIKIMIHCDKKK